MTAAHTYEQQQQQLSLSLSLSRPHSFFLSLSISVSLSLPLYLSLSLSQTCKLLRYEVFLLSKVVYSYINDDECPTKSKAEENGAKVVLTELIRTVQVHSRAV